MTSGLTLAARLLAIVLACVAGGAAASELRVTLLHVNDVYQLAPLDNGRSGGGLARLATLKARLRAASPHVLLTLGGDTLSPSVASSTFGGAQMIAGWNAVGLDLAVLGNHEFDFGPEVLRQRIAESAFPWLGANVERRRGARFAGLHAGVLRDFDGIRVGFLGVVTTDTARTSKSGAAIHFAEPLAAARREAARLRRGGAVAVVALTHLAMADDRRLARGGDIDLILGGHEHTLLQSLAGRAPIFKAGSDARQAIRVDLVFDREKKRLAHIDWQILAVDAELAEDPAVARLVAAYETRLAALVDQPAGETREVLDALQASNRCRETNLGDWLADVYRAASGAEVALINGGSIRSNRTLGPGPLTRRDILAVLPFENPIVKLDVPGRVLRQAIEHGLAELGAATESGRFPQVSGMRFSYDARRPPGARLTAISVGGRPLDDARHYALAVNGYLAGGGDGYTMLRGLPSLIAAESAPSETAAVIDALAAASPIGPVIDGRIERLDRE